MVNILRICGFNTPGIPAATSRNQGLSLIDNKKYTSEPVGEDGEGLFRDKSGGNLFTGQMVFGMKVE